MNDAIVSNSNIAIEGPSVKPDAIKVLTAERLRELLDYDAETGEFRWRVQSGRQKAGAIAGYVRHDGYLQIGIAQVVYYGHRLAWMHAHGDWPADQIDHADGNPINNRLINLRECSNAENCQNLGVRKSNTSGVTGVYWNAARSKWQAQIRDNGVVRALGRFTSFDDAKKAFAKAKAVAHVFQPTSRGASL